MNDLCFLGELFWQTIMFFQVDSKLEGPHSNLQLLQLGTIRGKLNESDTHEARS